MAPLGEEPRGGTGGGTISLTVTLFFFNGGSVEDFADAAGDAFKAVGLSDLLLLLLFETMLNFCLLLLLGIA